MKRKIFLFACIVLVVALVLYSHYLAKPVSESALMSGVLEAYKETGALNAVSAVYLDFRVFDTLFETFLLLTATLGLSQFLRLEQTERIHIESDENDNYRPSSIASSALHLTLPLFIIVGITVTSFGPNSPGGGFQGGAILAVLVMVLYLTDKHMNLPLLSLESLEKIVYIFFLSLVAIYFLLYSNFVDFHRVVYMILSNILISLKVFIGLIIVFLRLIGQSQHRTLGDAYE